MNSDLDRATARPKEGLNLGGKIRTVRSFLEGGRVSSIGSGACVVSGRGAGHRGRRRCTADRGGRSRSRGGGQRGGQAAPPRDRRPPPARRRQGPRVL